MSTKPNNALEQEISTLEQAQVAALLRNDIAAMKKNWATDYIVNNPRNEVVEVSNAESLLALAPILLSFVRSRGCSSTGIPSS